MVKKYINVLIYVYHNLDYLKNQVQYAFKGRIHWLDQWNNKQTDGVVSLCRICKRYDEMADKVSDIPDATKELVNLQAYLRQVSALSLASVLVWAECS